MRTLLFAILVVVVVLLPLIQVSYANEVSPTVIVDDSQTSFWTLQNEGTGNYTCSVWDNTVYRVSGLNSYKLYASAGTKVTLGAIHEYTVTQDWSSQEIFGLSFYGAASGMPINIFVYADAFPDYYRFYWIDETIGWQEKRISLDDFTENGSPSWATVKKIHIYIDSTGKTGAGYVFYFDRFILDTNIDTADSNLVALGLLISALCFTTIFIIRRKT